MLGVILIVSITYRRAIATLTLEFGRQLGEVWRRRWRINAPRTLLVCAANTVAALRGRVYAELNARARWRGQQRHC